MGDYLQAFKVTEKVYWVGAIDWDLRNFHGYATDLGTTYNAFLILDKKVTLIDTVKAPFFDEMVGRISSVISPDKIDYIISNHSEMDHSGSLPKAYSLMKPEKIFASPMGEKNLKAHFHGLPVDVVKTGDSLSLGESTLHFIETKMLHWPDSMVSYLDTEKLLFSQDAFGMHLAGSGRWYTDYEEYILRTEAQKYFANILLLYSGKILDLLKSLPGLNLDIKIVAPDHGPMWKGDGIGYILDLYHQFAEQKPSLKGVVIYDTMWHSTELMARSILDGMVAAGLEGERISLSASDRSMAITKLMDAGVVVVGSPTLNNNMYPTVADFLVYMRGLRPQNKIGGAFGSFGWSGEAAKQITGILQECNFELPYPELKVKYIPTASDLEKCFNFGKDLAEKLKEKLQ